LNNYLLSVVLGIIEGLTEYLPVSSTAHLRIAEALFHLSLSDGYWKMYTIVIQLGAILCLPVYFRDRIAKLLSTFPRGESGDRTILNHPLSLVLVAFVVTAIPSFLLTKVIGKHLESMPIIGWSLLIGGVVMWIVDAAKAKSGSLFYQPVGVVGIISPWNYPFQLAIMPLIAALGIAKDAIGNLAAAAAVEAAEQGAKGGAGLARPLAAAGLFPARTVHLLQLGEEAAQLSAMALKAADIHDEQARLMVQRLVALAVPLITIVMGLAVAGIVSALLTAMLSLNDLAG